MKLTGKNVKNLCRPEKGTSVEGSMVAKCEVDGFQFTLFIQEHGNGDYNISFGGVYGDADSTAELLNALGVKEIET